MVKSAESVKAIDLAVGGVRRAAVVVSLVLTIAGMAGCYYAKGGQSSRPVHCAPIEPIVQSDPASFERARLGVFLFRPPSYAVGIEEEVTAVYSQEFLRKGPFMHVQMVPRTVANDGEALWWGRTQGFDLVMSSAVLYFLDGSGAQETRLETEVRILDVRTGRTVWEIRQSAYSEPGMDIDLFWTTIPGQPARRYHALTKSLAEQLCDYFAAQDKKKKKA